MPVLSAHAEIPALEWLVFVEVPTIEAQQPVINAGLRGLALLVLGLLIAALAGALLARRMVVPIRALQAGAERIGSGELGHRIDDQDRRRAGIARQPVQPLGRRRCRSPTPPWSSGSRTARASSRERWSSRPRRPTSCASSPQSPTDVEPVLQAVAEAAAGLCRADEAAVFLFKDGAYRWAASAHIAST